MNYKIRKNKICVSYSAVHIFIWFSNIHRHLFVTSLVYLEPTLIWMTSSQWLVSIVGRALHRYHRDRGFKSGTGLNLFQALISLLLKQCSLLRRSLSYQQVPCENKENFEGNFVTCINNCYSGLQIWWLYYDVNVRSQLHVNNIYFLIIIPWTFYLTH